VLSSDLCILFWYYSLGCGILLVFCILSSLLSSGLCMMSSGFLFCIGILSVEFLLPGVVFLF